MKAKILDVLKAILITIGMVLFILGMLYVITVTGLFIYSVCT